MDIMVQVGVVECGVMVEDVLRGKLVQIGQMDYAKPSTGDKLQLMGDR